MVKIHWNVFIWCWAIKFLHLKNHCFDGQHSKNTLYASVPSFNTPFNIWLLVSFFFLTRLLLHKFLFRLRYQNAFRKLKCRGIHHQFPSFYDTLWFFFLRLYSFGAVSGLPKIERKVPRFPHILPAATHAQPPHYQHHSSEWYIVLKRIKDELQWYIIITQSP